MIGIEHLIHAFAEWKPVLRYSWRDHRWWLNLNRHVRHTDHREGGG